MSLEAALHANTQALTALHALLSAGATNAQPPLPIYGRASSDQPPVDMPAKVADKSPEPKAEAKAEVVTEAKPEVAPLTYKAVESAVLALAKVNGRDAAVKALQSVKAGAQKLPDILPVANEDKDKPLPTELLTAANAVIAACKA